MFFNTEMLFPVKFYDVFYNLSDFCWILNNFSSLKTCYQCHQLCVILGLTYRGCYSSSWPLQNWLIRFCSAWNVIQGVHIFTLLSLHGQNWPIYRYATRIYVNWYFDFDITCGEMLLFCCCFTLPNIKETVRHQIDSLHSCKEELY